MRVSRVGDDLMIKLPDTVVDALDIADGDDLIVHIAGKQNVLPETVKDREWAIERLKSFKIALPEDWKFDRDEANAR